MRGLEGSTVPSPRLPVHYLLRRATRTTAGDRPRPARTRGAKITISRVSCSKRRETTAIARPSLGAGLLGAPRRPREAVLLVAHAGSSLQV